MARTSLQSFNRGLNRDPGYWEEKDFRLDELRLWQDAGFPQGKGLPQPVRDPALDNPQTTFEKVISDFDAKLVKYRESDPDEKTNPGNYLTAASNEDMEAIKKRWILPKNYLIFLERFSPYNFTCELQIKFSSSGFDLYSASTILEKQAIFAFDPNTGKNYSDWSENYVVIGDAWADPFVFDLSKCDENDGPIFTAEHGTGEWSFRKYAKSFEALLQKLKVT
ncbi:MAG: SMI1/KNR4 family protein [Candidatus Obscuribacterales bacterium]